LARAADQALKHAPRVEQSKTIDTPAAEAVRAMKPRKEKKTFETQRSRSPLRRTPRYDHNEKLDKTFIAALEIRRWR
jgi:hypothetical protein